MNQRNLHFIYPNNARRDFSVADNKLLTKQILAENGVPVPETYKAYSSFFELRNLEEDLAAYDEFVIKPAQGSGGGGILVISAKTANGWVSVSGRTYTMADMRKHLADIIFGVYSFGLTDQVIIERRIEQHSDLAELSPFGLTDVRVIVFRDEPVLAMLRVPTLASDGKANLHQGALGIGVDIETGSLIHAIHKGASVTQHPNTGLPLLGRRVPFWENILHISRVAAGAVPLKYLGIDLAISSGGPLIVEINVRPGIEIQNANMLGMRPLLEQINDTAQQNGRAQSKP
ncbi:MAG TPA: sugar-transfer associated ATP-grasp domain-containing protein [Mariprofundaceae bacterium]|nr:sugar-transfer associated ATP-grasp domain-containing protein [Mariprofundaceae bacterium]